MRAIVFCGYRFDIQWRDSFGKGVAGVMAQIFDNSETKQMINRQHAYGIAENFALTPFLYESLKLLLELGKGLAQVCQVLA